MLKNKQFMYLLVGQTAANLGDVFYSIAIISLIYNATGSAFYTSTITFTMAMAIFTSGILTPLVLDKVHLNRVLTGTQGMKTILLFSIWAYLSLTVELVYWVIFVFFVSVSFLDGFAGPIKQSLIPYYVEEEELMKANSLAESIDEVMQVGNWVIGGSLLLWFSSKEIIFISFGLYIVATIAFTSLRKVTFPEKVEQTSKFSQATEGISLFLKETHLRKYLIIDSLETIAAPVWNSSILLIYVAESLREPPIWWGLINAAFFAGMICISLFMYRHTEWVQKNLSSILLLGVGLTASATFLFGYTNLSSIALFSSLLVGVGTQLKNIPLLTMFQEVAPKEKLPVLYAAEGSLLTPLMGVASLVVGFFADQTSISFVYYLSALILAVGGIFYLQLIRQYLTKQVELK
ncbi:MFS transporter [Atopococcus tabaci]|uniref:MFS transporter n=1 Tax=Atopococcus tabaci TaxID=269774 RepID=UPI00041F00D6|nr:MFS transporter [Atopococcus tabaci]